MRCQWPGLSSLCLEEQCHGQAPSPLSSVAAVLVFLLEVRILFPSWEWPLCHKHLITFLCCVLGACSGAWGGGIKPVQAAVGPSSAAEGMTLCGWGRPCERQGCGEADFASARW